MALFRRRTKDDADAWDAGPAESAEQPAGADAPRRSWRGPIQIAIVLALIAAAVFYARQPGRDEAGGPPPVAMADPDAPKPLVSVFRPARTHNVMKVVATGSVTVRNHIALTPQVGGRVVSISPALRAGGSFSAGESLLVIDRRDFELALDQARADVAAAHSSVMLQTAEGDAARSNYGLLHPGEEVPPLVARVPQLAQARSQLAAALAREKIAALDLSRTTFSLPFDGMVTESTAEIGQVLTRGQSFGRAFALDSVEVVAPLPAADLERLAGAAGRRAEVREGEAAYEAVVERVGAELDERTRFATLYLSPAGDGRLPGPGTFVDVTIDGPALADTFLLPEAAEQLGGAVWIVDDGRLKRLAPRSHGRVPGGWVVGSFDSAGGVVLGAVPGAREGLEVNVEETGGGETLTFAGS